MNIPIEQITPGVWECRTDYDLVKYVRVERDRVSGVLIVYDVVAKKTLDGWIACGWTFTARYVRCEGEPMECWGERHADGAIHNIYREAGEYAKRGLVHGLFIPTKEPTP